MCAPEIPGEIGYELAPKLPEPLAARAPGQARRHGGVVDFGECVTLRWLRTSLAIIAGALGASL